jgi:adenosylcobyric acid synthase
VKGALLVCGTGSDVGKSHVVTGLCRLLVRRGVRVAPFKAQNMALNSFVTPDGGEIGRAQAAQAMAARVPAEVAMNPILLKPTGERTSQVVVRGRPLGQFTAAEYHELKPDLLDTVLTDLADLRRRFDVVIAEGAGSPTEINLLDHDIVNLRVAHEAGMAAVVVGDIDRGGVFAALYGTVALLPPHYRDLVRGFVINKFRGDPDLLGDGTAELESRCGVPTLGIVPMVDDLQLDAEDSLALEHARPRPAGPALGGHLDVAVVRFPRISNFTDLDALSLEPGVIVRFVEHGDHLGHPDLVVLPGTKATVDDLAWLRERGLDRAVAATEAVVLGICGGYQMLGHEIVDDVESDAGRADGLGLLDLTTRFATEKTTRQRVGTALAEPVAGYEIHHGIVARGAGCTSWLDLDGGESEGAVDDGAGVWGTSLHGVFENDRFRARFLEEVARRRGASFVAAGVSFAAAREAQFDRLADLLEAHLDLDRLVDLIESATPPPAPVG